MKKYSEFELIGIGITLLVLCILISLIGKHVFDLEGDYLSAAATLFAAVVAMLLFNDWQEPYSAQKINDERNLLRVSIKDFRNNYYALSTHILSAPKVLSENGDYFREYIKLEAQLLNSLDDVSENLNFYANFFLKDSNDKNYNIHKENLIAYSGYIRDFHAKFNQADPYTEFPKVFAIVEGNVRNNFFIKIVIKLSKDFINELAIMQGNDSEIIKKMAQ